MESYEHFYSRTLNSLLPPCSTAPRPQRALSHIHFHGRRLLEPLLSEEQRAQMADDRQTALERDRQRQTDALLERVQHILHITLKKTRSGAVTPPSDSPPLHHTGSSCSTRAGSAPEQTQKLSASSRLRRETLDQLNRRLEKLQSEESSDGADPQSPESSLASLSASLTGSYAQLPGPKPSLSPVARRARRPRPHGAGNILISCPVSESELSTAGSERPGADSEPWDCSCSGFGDGQLSIITSTPSSTSGRKREEKPRATRRSPPAPLNRSYDVENPEPSLIRPRVESGPSDGTTRHTLEKKTQDEAEVEQQMEALEAMRERLEREHAHQISELLQKQQRQTQHLQQELQRKLNEQSRKSLMSPAPDLQPAHMKTKHTCGTHTSHTQEECVDQMRSACRLTAAARGFLTRRLLQTEKITHLRKTIQDSREFIRSLQTDPQLKRVSVSHQDLHLQRRVTAQLRAARRDVHQIFFVWPVRDRLNLLQQDREKHRERTLRETENNSPGNTRFLSSATQKTLERKIQRQVKKLKVIPESSAVRSEPPAEKPSLSSAPEALMIGSSCSCRISLSSAHCSQSAVEKRDECLRARQKPLYRKYLSLG